MVQVGAAPVDPVSGKVRKYNSKPLCNPAHIESCDRDAPSTIYEWRGLGCNVEPNRPDEERE